MTKTCLAWITAVILSFLICPATFATDAPLMDFQPDTGGKYIYCNNPEAVRREHLADNSNPNARFIMNNENLTPDVYAMFISLVNHTELNKPDGGYKEPGFDIEVDALFRAKEDTEIRFTAMGFEVPEQRKYYLDGNTYSGEEDLGCFTAWASYMNMPISQLDSGKKYIPVPFEEKIITLKAGEEFWMSCIIPNYRVVPFSRVVHIMTDFEILSGMADVNIAALRSTGTVGDRSGFVKDASFGSYIRENQHKGIADSLNKTDVNLHFTIDDSFVDGTYLPVKIVNQYAYTGNTVTKWFTNMNPRADVWNKYSAAESSLLKFRYRDPKKLYYYGSRVKEKDDVWYFDTEHADTAEYPGKLSGKTKAEYVPNFPLKGAVDESLCPNLGNYGVFQNYHVTVQNTAQEDKYLLYKLNTVSNNLIILRDEKGEILSSYPLTKGATPTKENDCLACVKLPAGKETAFTLTVVLTTNHYGGMENGFEISDKPMPVKQYPTMCYYNVKDKNFTGRETLQWKNSDIWISEAGEEFRPVGMSPELEKKLHGRSGEVQFLHTPEGYMVRPSLYDGNTYYYVRDFYRDVYLLDESFTLKDTHTFDMYPADMSYANGTYYVKAGTVYESDDFKEWKVSALTEIPVGNCEHIGAYMRNGSLYVRVGDKEYVAVRQNEPIPYIDSIGNLFYYAEGSNLYLSKNLVHWKKIECESPITSVAICNGKLKTDNRDVWIPFEEPKGTLIYRENGVLAMSESILQQNGTMFIPLRAFCEAADAEITWDETSGAKVTYLGKTQYFKKWNINGVMYITQKDAERIVGEKVTVYPDAIIIE